MRIKLGLKAWSTNLGLINEAKVAYSNGELDYVEVFCVPGSANETASPWAAAGLPYVVHAPHSMAGLNFSLPEMAESNLRLVEETYYFADKLKTDIIIFHPGVGGTIKETLRQIEQIVDPRFVIENKPFLGLNGQSCVGSTPHEIEQVCNLDIGGFCLDFGHAIAASSSFEIPAIDYIKKFMKLSPVMYHLTDGDMTSKIDRHDQYGQGNFPLKDLLSFLPDNAWVTDESKRSNPDSVKEYLQDRSYIGAVMNAKVSL